MARTPRPGPGAGREFLFLQGPHGPFFGMLAKALAETGAECRRIGLNGGDRVFWPRPFRLERWRDGPEAWRNSIHDRLRAGAVTDLVVYGDARPFHGIALEAARNAGVRTHIFEEGYLRPHWITYERTGSNGSSRLARMSPEEIRALNPKAPHGPRPSGGWGATQRHRLWGALYHAAVLAGPEPGFPHHRDRAVCDEARQAIRHALFTPARRAARIAASRRVGRLSAPFHMVLLQLDHDASFRRWSPYTSNEVVIAEVLEAFAHGAPPHHHLVFKTHPLEDGRLPLRRRIRARSARLGLTGRVHFIPGGKLAHLLDHAASAVTVNSTAAHQALWRGLPVKALGEAVYTKPGLVSNQSLSGFFADPHPPDADLYAGFRELLLATCQYPGSYYASGGRRQALRHIVDRVLDPADPFDLAVDLNAAAPQHLSVVRS